MSLIRENFTYKVIRLTPNKVQVIRKDDGVVKKEHVFDNTIVDTKPKMQGMAENLLQLASLQDDSRDIEYEIVEVYDLYSFDDGSRFVPTNYEFIGFNTLYRVWANLGDLKVYRLIPGYKLVVERCFNIDNWLKRCRL